MTEFDIKATGWDLNPMHWERSEAVAKQILESISLNPLMTALEYGAGTGITSFLLKDYLKEITMMDSSAGMIKIMDEKIKAAEARNLKTLLFNLEKENWKGDKFDLLLTQMVLHHVIDIDSIFKKFYNIITPGGSLAIADLYPEDGSFHGSDFNGHNGFDTEMLADRLRNRGFVNVSAEKCFTINKKISETESGKFDIFLLIAIKPKALI